METFMKWTFAWIKNPPRVIKVIECVQYVTIIHNFINSLPSQLLKGSKTMLVLDI